MLVTKPDILQRWLKYLHRSSGLTDREIATKPLFSGIPPGTINTMRKHGQVPKKWRAKLHIVCRHCGRPHHRYDCTQEKPVPIAAETYNPATHALRKIAPSGTPRKRRPRTEICENTAPSAIAKRLYEVTGTVWVPLEGEIEY